MDYQKYEIHCSIPRLKRYYDSVGGDTQKAILLYNLNMKLSQAFFLPLTVFEVTLRNRLHNVLTSHFGDTDWIMNQKTGFMSDPALINTSRRTGQQRPEGFLKSQVVKAESEIRRRSVPVVSGRVIAEQPFSFWITFFNREYFRVLRSVPIQIFSTLPPGKGRHDVSSALDDIRRLRNRIFHHEPICFTNNHAIDPTHAENIKSKIAELLDWIDTDICIEFSDIHSIDNIVSQIRGI